MTTHEPQVLRHHSKTARNPLGKPLVIRVQGACSCGWRGLATYSLLSSIEGWELAERDATEHAEHPPNPTCEWFALCDHEAAGTLPHPALGPVPTCQRCADRFGATLSLFLEEPLK